MPQPVVPDAGSLVRQSDLQEPFGGEVEIGFCGLVTEQELNHSLGQPN
jgi:hypothetical protein